MAVRRSLSACQSSMALQNPKGEYHRFGAGTLLRLLKTTVKKGFYRRTSLQQQTPHASRATKFVGGQTKGGHPELAKLNIDLADRLNRIGMKNDALSAACRCNLSDWLQDASFVVSQHDAY